MFLEDLDNQMFGSRYRNAEQKNEFSGPWELKSHDGFVVKND
jgi:hypothetical protein